MLASFVTDDDDDDDDEDDLYEYDDDDGDSDGYCTYVPSLITTTIPRYTFELADWYHIWLLQLIPTLATLFQFEYKQLWFK
ncbi:hypothetical protein M0804_007874 [Polistes exclamans]|nr:hypothetical protein M0804_007874 [Polistes exclamans]